MDPLGFSLDNFDAVGQWRAKEAGAAIDASGQLADGTKVTVYFRKPQLRTDGILPKGGIARFYGTARLHKSGPVYEQVWTRLIQPEKDRDPDKKGFAVLIEVERAEELDGAPLAPT